jgi:hypothetical protein
LSIQTFRKEVEMAHGFQWWGYGHINGNVQVKRFFDQRDLDEARESFFVDRVVEPFLATDREDALRIMKEKEGGKSENRNSQRDSSGRC